MSMFSLFKVGRLKISFSVEPRKPIKYHAILFAKLFKYRGIFREKKRLTSLHLRGTNPENPVLDPPVVLHPNNQLYIYYKVTNLG